MPITVLSSTQPVSWASTSQPRGTSCVLDVHPIATLRPLQPRPAVVTSATTVRPWTHHQQPAPVSTAQWLSWQDPQGTGASCLRNKGGLVCRGRIGSYCSIKLDLLESCGPLPSLQGPPSTPFYPFPQSFSPKGTFNQGSCFPGARRLWSSDLAVMSVSQGCVGKPCAQCEVRAGAGTALPPHPQPRQASRNC